MSLITKADLKNDIIVWCLRFYQRHIISYRDLEKLLLRRGFKIDHTTLFRYVKRYEKFIDGLEIIPSILEFKKNQLN